MAAAAGAAKSRRGWFIGRYWSLAASAVVCGTATGLGYCFSTYSPALKALDLGNGRNMTQSSLDAISNAQSYLALPPVVLLPGWLVYRTGPRGTLVFAAACLLLGYGAMFLAATGKAASMIGMPSNWLPAVLAAALAIASFGSGTATVAVMATTVDNFPHRRGVATGFLKSLTGLAGGMVTQVYLGFLAPHTFSLLLMLALGSSGAVLLSAIFINVVPWPVEQDPDPPRRRCELRRFAAGLLGMATLAATVMVSALIIHSDGLDGDDASGSGGSERAGHGSQPNIADRTAALAVMCVFASVFLLFPCGTRLIVHQPALSPTLDVGPAAAAAPSPAIKTPPASHQIARSRYASAEELSPWEAMRTIDCWLFVWTDAVCQG
jgi:MFS family permease